MKKVILLLIVFLQKFVKEPPTQKDFTVRVLLEGENFLDSYGIPEDRVGILLKEFMNVVRKRRVMVC